MNQHRVDYLLIGGYAVAYHGYVRATGDMDVFIRPTEENGAKLCRVFRDFGLGGDFKPDFFCEPGRILRFGLPPLRLEILNDISGVGFAECMEAAVSMRLEDVAIPVISLECLLRNKAASGRDKDLLDIQRLQN